MDGSSQAMVGCDDFKQGAGMLSLHLRRATGGAAGQDSFEVTGGKTCYQAAAGAQVRDNLSLIPDQS